MGFEFSKAKNLKNIPEAAGVYFFKDQRGKILYIGKAANLRKRINQYFQKKLDPRLSQMINQAYKVDFIKTDSEIAALLLESEMIKRYQPKYNIELKDDKNFLWIKITLKEDFPGLFLVRQPWPDQSEYFGPFTDAKALRTTLKLLRRIFPFRTTTQYPHPLCLWGHLKMCPCLGMTKKEYQKSIKNLIRFLKGQSQKVIEALEKEMRKFAQLQEFEKAAQLRDKISLLKRLKEMIIFGHQERLELEADLALKSLAKTLGLPSLPARIECYDVSNLAGQEATGSMVVFQNGLPAKDQYRKFKIKRVRGIDDYAMMKEILDRRFKEDWPLADLIVIDGGKGQVGAAGKVLEDYRLKIPLIGLAKRKEEIYALRKSGPKGQRGEQFFEKIVLPSDSPALFLLQRLRDEAHRWALIYHRLLRQKKLKVSLLDEIEGVGPKTKKKLLKYFGSLKKIKEASQEELSQVVGPKLASKIKENLI